MNDQEVYIQCKILLDVSKKKYQLLKEVHNLTENQKAVIEHWETGEDLFQQMAKEKQSRITEINELDERFLGIYSSIKTEIKNNLSTFKPIMQQIKNKVQEIMDLGIKIQIVEEDNRKLLESKFTKPKQIIRKLPQNSAKSITAYKKFVPKKEQKE